jgi:hypothetical protein
MADRIDVRVARIEVSMTALYSRMRALERLPGRIDGIERAHGEEGAARSATAQARSVDAEKRNRRERRLYAVAGLVLTTANLSAIWFFGGH